MLPIFTDLNFSGYFKQDLDPYKFSLLVAVIRIFFLDRLAVADLLMSSVGVITPFIASYNQTWPFGEIGCAYDGFIHYVVGNSYTIIHSFIHLFIHNAIGYSKTKSFILMNLPINDYEEIFSDF